MSTRTLVAWIAVWTLISWGPIEARAGGGIGILGDSYSDEYQFYAPHRDKARNWVEILAATRHVDFGEFRETAWDGTRNCGFAYNWAKSGATSATMIAEKQHEGLANQVAQGHVSIAIVFVGGNDFIAAINAANPRSELAGLGRKVAANVKMATQTLLEAGPDVKLVVATVPDIRELPEFRRGKLDPTIAALAVAEIDALNLEIRRMPKPRNRVAVFDFAKISRISQMLAPTHVKVADRLIERDRVGDTADRLFLGDSRHIGTMAQGMIAKLLTDCLNKNCAAGIKPLDEQEIVRLADSLAETAIASSVKVDGARP